MTSHVRAASQPNRIHPLTSLRFFAALYILVFHVHWPVSAGTLLDRMIGFGPVSVSFFFLLSGYILGIVYLKREGGFSTPLPKFFVARFARIYPLYITAVLADVPWAISGRIAKYGLLVAIERIVPLVGLSVIMQQMWLPMPKVINIPSWSLSVEAVFYLAFPFIGPSLWKTNWRNAWIASAGLYGLALALSYVINLLAPDHPSGFDIVSYLSIFSLGILLARLQVLWQRQRSTQVLEAKWAWLLLVASCLAFVCAMFSHDHPAFSAVHFGILLAPVFAAVIFALANSPQIFVARALSITPLVVLGEASYALYLLHTPIRHLFIIHRWDRPQYYACFVLTCIAVSLGSFYLYETPVRRFILAIWGARQTPETLELASNA